MGGDGAPAGLPIRDSALSGDGPYRRLDRALHQLRSSLAAVIAEAEVLDVEGVNSARLRRACDGVLHRLEITEQISDALEYPGNRTRVVLLEDDEQLGLALMRRLARLGIDACLVTTWMAAVTWSTHGVLIADLSALESVNQEHLQHIRSCQPVILTGATTSTSKQGADRFGAFATFTKPADLTALAATIREHPASGSG
jgi:hypothetical protein